MLWEIVHCMGGVYTYMHVYVGVCMRVCARTHACIYLCTLNDIVHIRTLMGSFMLNSPHTLSM